MKTIAQSFEKRWAVLMASKDRIKFADPGKLTPKEKKVFSLWEEMFEAAVYQDRLRTWSFKDGSKVAFVKNGLSHVVKALPTGS
jgi:hypothetical protein